MDIAARRGLAVVEDAAHGAFGRYKGRMLGTFGSHGHLELSRDQELHQRRRGRRHPAQRRASSSSGPRSCAKRAPTGPSSSAARSTNTPGSTSARATCPRTCWPLSSWPSWRRRLRSRPGAGSCGTAIATVWRSGRSGWAPGSPSFPPDCDSSYHLFHLILPTPEKRDALMNGLKARGVLAVFHYLPLHLSPMGRTLGIQGRGFSGDRGLERAAPAPAVLQFARAGRPGARLRRDRGFDRRLVAPVQAHSMRAGPPSGGNQAW